MTNNVKTLRLGDMIFGRGGSFVRRAVVFIFSVALKLFFRRIETVNAADVPKTEPVIFVMNHPNGLIDPALVFVALPRKISFLAKSTLFTMPVIGWLLRTVEALPIYRKIDAGADVSKNNETFTMSRELLKKGGAIAIFPEGISHNETKLQPLKTGAARIALGAVSVGKNPASLDLKIVPVGLFYTSKTMFRSEAMLYFGKAFPVLPVELEDEEPPRQAVTDLTAQIEKSLREVTLNAESNAELETATQAEELFSSVYEGINFQRSLADRFAFLKTYISDKLDERYAPKKRDENLEKRIASYEKKLRELEIEPENLSLVSHSFWYVFRHFLVRVWVLLVFAPISIFGIILHFPAYQLGKFIANRNKKHGADDIVSTVKILAAMVFMPLTWIIFAAILYFVWDFWWLAILSIPFAVFSGYTAMRSLEEIEDLRGWFHAIKLFYLKREKFLQLLVERRSLHEALENKSEKIGYSESV